MLHVKSYPAHNEDVFLLKADSPRPAAVLVDGGSPPKWSSAP